MQITIGGLNINYNDTLTGEKTVVLLHGWGSSNEVYNSITACIRDRFRVIAPDFPGCGKSDTMKEPWNIDDYCNFVLKFLNALEIKDPIIMGHSHGGRVIMKLAGSGLLNPEKIVFFDTAGLIPKKSFKQKFKTHSFKTIKRILTLPGIRNYSENLLQKAKNHYGSADYNAAPEVLRKTLVSLVNTDLRDLLVNIKCPTLLIWGDKDTATPLSDAKIIESKISDCGLCVIEGTGHFSFCENPRLANAIVNSFLS